MCWEKVINVITLGGGGGGSLLQTISSELRSLHTESECIFLVFLFLFLLTRSFLFTQLTNLFPHFR